MMNNIRNNSGFSEFIEIIQSCWGIISTLTIVFPAGNHIAIILPLVPNHDKIQLFIGTLSAFFALLTIFTLRYSFPKKSVMFSIISFCLGLLFLGIYMVLLGNMVSYDPIIVAILIIAYSLSSAFFTIAFSLIAIREYLFSIKEIKISN